MNKLPVIFSPLALADTEEAYTYYEEKQIGLGNRFVAQLQHTLNTIKNNPTVASIRYDNIRCAQIKKFPYLVHYHIDAAGKLVTILAVYSTYREPLGI